MDVLGRTLHKLRKDVLPHVQEPLLYVNLLLDASQQDVSFLSTILSCLLELVQKHGVECPRLYDRSYRLLERKRHEKMFPRLGNGDGMAYLSLLLSSTHVPAYVVAAYAKRLSKRSCRSTPSAAICSIALARNALRRHASCHVLIRRARIDATSFVPEVEMDERGGFERGSEAFHTSKDPFSDEEEDPSRSRALESALWEFGTLRRKHYHPTVRSLASLLDADSESLRTKSRDVDLNSLSCDTYESMIHQDCARPSRKLQMEYREDVPERLFEDGVDDVCFNGWSWSS